MSARLPRERREELVALVGSDGEVDTSETALDWSAGDAAGSYRLAATARRAHPPMAVVRPAATESVAAVVRWANRRHIALVPRGSGTGVMGGAVPLQDAIVLEMERMRRVQIQPEDGLALAEAGAILGAVNAAARPSGMMLGHDPWSVDIASVGGAINTDGMGYMAGRWGSMGEQVAGLEAVLGDGAVVATPPVKPSLGPDLRPLLAGSQGSLGIVTRAWLRLIPLPQVQLFRCFRFRGFEPGFHAIGQLWKTGLRYDLLDFTDNPPDQWGLDPGMEDAAGRTAILHLAALGEPEEADARMAVALRTLIAMGAQDLGPDRAEEYWNHRHDIAEAYARDVQHPKDANRRRERGTVGLDYLNLAMPPHRILGYRRRALERVARETHIVAGETGIWCRPEVFSLVLFEPNRTETSGRFSDDMERLMTDLLTLAVEEGGNIECIHGPGLKLLPLVGRDRGGWLDYMRAIKQAVDPNGVLNPGKLSEGL